MPRNYTRDRSDRTDREVRVHQRGETGAPESTTTSEASIGELFKRLTSDTTELIRAELTLARAEMRATAAAYASDATKIGIAVGLALAGVLALGAFAVVGLGDLFNNYWLAALIVGVVLLGVGGYLVRNAVADMKRHSLAPRETMETLRDDASWVKQEGRELKRELTR